MLGKFWNFILTQIDRLVCSVFCPDIIYKHEYIDPNNQGKTKYRYNKASVSFYKVKRARNKRTKLIPRDCIAEVRRGIMIERFDSGEYGESYYTKVIVRRDDPFRTVLLKEIRVNKTNRPALDVLSSCGYITGKTNVPPFHVKTEYTRPYKI